MEKELSNVNTFMKIKNKILEMYPIRMPRLEEDKLLKADAPEMKIEFNFYKDKNNYKTQVIFLDGDSRYLSSVYDFTYNGLISYDVVNELISFILCEYPYIIVFSSSSNYFEMTFTYSLENYIQRGISARNIHLSFKSRYELDIIKDYLKNIFSNFYEALSSVESIKEKYQIYLNEYKKDFFDSLDRNELIKILNMLSNDSIRNILYYLSNEEFINIHNELNTNHERRYKMRKLVSDNNIN